MNQTTRIFQALLNDPEKLVVFLLNLYERDPECFTDEAQIAIGAFLALAED